MMEKPFNRPSCSRQESGPDSVFKVPPPVFKSSANRFTNLQLRNGSELSFRMNRANQLAERSNISRNNISENTSQIQSSFKIPMLGTEYRSNEVQQMSFAAERSVATTSSAANSFLQIDTRKGAAFSSGLSFPSSKELVRRGTFNSTLNFQNRSLRQNSILPNSSRLHMTSNVDDNQSIAGSVVSMTSNLSTVAISAQLMNIFESLENTLVKNQPVLTTDELRAVVRKAKEVAINTIQNDSMALSVREGDTGSVFNESVKSLCSTFSKPRTRLPNVTSMKCNRDVLAELRLENQPSITSGQNSQFQFFTAVETTRRNVDHVQNDDGDDHENDRTVIFNNVKRLEINSKRKQINEKVADQKVSAQKSTKSREVVSVIVLRHWFPVAIGDDLAFSGTTERNDSIETKPIKKRISNRKVELVDGKICEIVGSPSTTVVSEFPKDISKKLKNGLHTHWKVLQKNLANCQRNFHSKREQKNSKSKGKPGTQIVEYTPRTRNIARVEKSISPLNSSTPLRRNEPDGKKKNNTRKDPVVLLERSDLSVKLKEYKNADKDKGENSKKPEKEQEKRKEKKIVEASGSEKRKSKDEEPVQRTRSGRTVKPLGGLWTDGSFIFNVKRAETPDSSSAPKKRKLEGSQNENEVKPAKIKKASPEKKKKKESPELNNSSVKIPSPKKKGTPLPKSLLGNKNSKGVSKVEKNRKNEKSKKKNEDKKKVSKEVEKKNSKNSANKSVAVAKDYNDSFDGSLGDIDIPVVKTSNSKTQLSKSQIQMISMETPPLKYFTGNLRLANTVTPNQSPDWQLSQRTESEVKRFQKRREKTFKQKIPAEKPQPVNKVRKSPRNKDLDNVMNWIADKDVKSPKKRSKLLNLVIPSRRYEEEDEDESEDEEYDE